MNTAKFCQDQFGFELHSVLIIKPRDIFLAKYEQIEIYDSRLILLFADIIIRKLCLS